MQACVYVCLADVAGNASLSVFVLSVILQYYSTVTCCVCVSRQGGRSVCISSTTRWWPEFCCEWHYHCCGPVWFWLVAWSAAWSDWHVSFQLHRCCDWAGACQQWIVRFISHAAYVLSHCLMCKHRGSTGLAEHFLRTTYHQIWPPMTYVEVKCHITAEIVM